MPYAPSESNRNKSTKPKTAVGISLVAFYLPENHTAYDVSQSRFELGTNLVLNLLGNPVPPSLAEVNSVYLYASIRLCGD
jgi:hypothetical protein